MDGQQQSSDAAPRQEPQEQTQPPQEPAQPQQQGDAHKDAPAGAAEQQEGQPAADAPKEQQPMKEIQDSQVVNAVRELLKSADLNTLTGACGARCKREVR